MKYRTGTQRTIAGLLVVMWMSHTVLAGAIIYVDPLAPGADDGSSWDDACICLQNALERGRAGDEIRVAQGTYRPDRRTITSRARTSREAVASGLQTESFVLPEGVAVKGGYAGYGHPNPDARNIEAYASILSGDLSDNDIELSDLEWDSLLDFVTHVTLIDNAHTVVTARNASSQTVLDGFTITAGRGDGGSSYSTRTRGITTSVALPQPSDDTEGAGAYVDSGSPVFTNCTFYRNTVKSLSDQSTGGAGVVNDQSNATFQACTFQENIAFGYGGSSLGAAVLNFRGAPKLVHCTFKNNVTAGFNSDYVGGAVANVWTSAELTGCTFIVNKAIDSEGGAIYNYGDNDETPQIVDCTFTGNSADLGGAISSQEEGNVNLVGCIFLANETLNAGQGGAVYNGIESISSLLNCRFLGNMAAGQGGAVYGAGPLTIINCVFSGNSAATGGAIHDDTDNGIEVVNGTFTANHASENGGAYYGLAGQGRFTNCILWDDAPQEVYSLTGTLEIVYSNVQGYSSTQEGNVDADPRFQDRLGTDEIIGTLDDDLSLLVGSPCIDAGRNAALPESVTTDLARQARIANARVDMGAYEFDGPYNYYVDATVGDDTFEGYSPDHAFATIQRGIEVAQDGYTVVVLPGLYTEEVNFDGKAITVAGSEGGAIIEAPNGYGVSFYTAERSSSVLKNLVIQNCDVGIFIAGASPTIQHITLAGNEFGIAAYAGANPDIGNCILWNNVDGDLFGCTAQYSCIEDESEGEGNISEDPLFADANGGDFHLLSEKGRFVPAYGLWSFDLRTSPCIDAGNPLLSPGAERMPNGGRINMGAFGGTREASMSEWPLSADINRDGIVDEADLAILEAQWLQELPTAAGASSTDTDPPQPNPARWDIDGLPQEIHNGGGALDYSVEMTAAEATDPGGPVEYFFECRQAEAIQPDGFSSGWQTERHYVVDVGRADQDLEFRVQARDPYGNVTAWSEWARVQ